MDERDYRRGHGRALQRGNRAIGDGETAFRAGFIAGVLPTRDTCRYCEAGATLTVMKRQSIHYVDRRIIVCTKD